MSGSRAISVGGSQLRVHAGDVALEVAHATRIIEGGEHLLAVARGAVDFHIERLQRTIEHRRSVPVEMRMSAAVDQAGCK